MEEWKTTIQKRKLPWDDDPRLGRFIDDNALYVLNCVSKGRFIGMGASYMFFVASCRPLEWDHKTLVKFLIRTAEEYGIELKNLATMTYAFTEEYEEPTFDEKTGKPFVGFEKEWEEYDRKYQEYEKCKKKYKDIGDQLFSKECFGKFPMQPRKYGGAYQWALGEIKKNPQTPEGKLLSKIFDNKFELADLKEAVKISDWVLTFDEPEDSDSYLAKKIFNDIVDWSSFEILPDKQTAEMMRIDLNDYLERFINNKLETAPNERRINNVRVLQNSNVFTFNKHKEMMFTKFREMQENYGNTFVFENPFEEIPFEEPRNDENIRQRYAARQFLFMHIVFALEKLGYIKILTLGNNWHWTGANDNDLKCDAKIQLLTPILKELGTESKRSDLSFDEDKSRLFIQGTEIKIQKFSDQYHALRIIFANPKEVGQEWFFSEMAEKYDIEADFDDKKFYNAIYQVGLKAKSEGFPDFFITTRQSAKLNPKYLS